ncbi:MAG: alpha/beta hydrolase [Actinobacteria bacterium]|nr:alpha/beta hydrolase [Actinomycetota bacterium]
MDTVTVEVGGQRARLLDAGSGPPVVVLHGWGGRIESMAPIAACLSRGFRVLAPDLPGFGESPIPRGLWGTPDYATWIGRVVRTRHIERAHFVGHSFGAKTALQIAATQPELVDRLVAVGSPGLRTPPSASARLKRTLSKAAKAAGVLGPPGRAFKEAVFNKIASQDYRDAGELRPIFVKVVNEDLSDLLPQILAPTLLVWGAEEDAVPVEHGRRMAKLIPDAGLVLFEGAGHFAYLDDPGRFCRVVRHFFGAP